MSREARQNINGNAFHVLVRSVDGINCFDTQKGKALYISCLDRARIKYDLSILAYCVMPDHAHVLLMTDEDGSAKLSLCMTHANSQYAKWYNFTNDHDGKVFKDRFKAETLENAKQVSECVKFIHADPIRMEIVDNIEKYQASSYVDYLAGKGIVDYALATKYFNPSPSALRTGITHINSFNFIDTEIRRIESEDDIFEYVIEKYNISNEEELKDSKLLKAIALEIISLTNMSIRELSKKLGINRERLRRVLKA